ncbi:MAG: FecR domain-containing protein [Myxococcota bacterium]|nr:FecR family protein [Myxococcota bacterium]
MNTLILITHLVLAQTPVTARVVQVIGKVELISGQAVAPLDRFGEVPMGTIIATGDDGRCSLRLPSGTLIRLGSNTRVEVASLTRGDPAAARKETIKVSVGRLWAKVTKLFGNDSRFEVQTDNAVAGVRGTAFFVETNGKQDQFVVDHGAISVNGAGGSLSLDGPGAAGGFHDGTLSPTNPLSAGALAAMRADVGGGVTNLLADTDPTGTTSREPFRDTLVGPDDPVDDLQPAARPTDSFGGDASITVRLIVPNL